MVTHQVLTQYRSGPPASNAVAAMNSIGLEAIRFFGPVDVTARLVIAVDLDRNFLADRTNGSFVLGARQNF